MADLTPAEMREAAFDLRLNAELIVQRLQLGTAGIRAMRAGADALDRLADALDLHSPRDEEAITGDCAEESCDHEGPCPTQTFQVCAECWRVAEESDPYFGERGITPVLWPCATARTARGDTAGDENRIDNTQAPCPTDDEVEAWRALCDQTPGLSMRAARSLARQDLLATRDVNRD